MDSRDQFFLRTTARINRASRPAPSLRAPSQIPVVLLLLALCSPALSQSVSETASSQAKVMDERACARATANTTSPAELERLRGEVGQLRAEIARLRYLVEAAMKGQEATALDASSTKPAAAARETTQQETRHPDPQAAKDQSKTLPELTPGPEQALTSKAQGGDLSGAGNLLHTDRITIGGYGDFQYRQSSINERADGGGTPTFQNTRLVLGIAAVLAEKQNIVFNSEIEYEFGSREIDVEQAYVEWRLRPQFAFRGGIIIPSIGRFNTYHDSYLNLTTIRPLINQFIVPTAYRDAGIAVRGKFKLPHKMKLTYDAAVVNGMRGRNNDGEPTPFSRLLGQSSASEPGLFAFQAQNRSKAVVGRIGVSPVVGLEMGAAVYNGRFNDLGAAPQSATILFFDASYHHGALTVNGEFGRSNIVGGIGRKSPTPPILDPDNPESIGALAEFVAQRSPGQDGFYLEGTYAFSPRRFGAKFDDGSYIAPVVRYEVVRVDRTIPSFYLNRSRTTVGLNIAPSSTVILKLNYLFNHTFGPVPSVSAAVGGALFGASPLPHLGYGRNGFTCSIAYVF
jgi:hypothetical protein